ncbi:Nicotinamidase-related amidase [Syntrophus gentianae]|uniref:Nicotinamidase-related amidase n=1 Tax=Syntrophus gentianae TaxID=43775 RepID=A0A1H8ADV2_9BACT|nr:cysteine hydrolase family protein [Syntrophus gentianae]SEM68114.1 Nicotinamidase-related amidase [Syntrophus gentianae]
MSHQSSALLCIDLQREYFDPGRPLWVPEGAFVLTNTAKLVHKARHIGTPVVHVRHVSRKPGAVTFAPNSEFLEFPEDVSPRDGEYVITKSRPGAFYETALDAHLQSLGITRLFLCGLLSFMCVDTTAREAHARGYEVIFVRDATAALPIGDLSADVIHRVVCAIQGWMFSKVVCTDDAIKLLTGEPCD